MKYTKAKLNQLKKAKNNIKDTTNRSHFRKQPVALEGAGLSPTQIVMLTYIYDTMELSWTNGDQYYDKKRHNYYAVVSRKTMNKLYGIKDTAAGENLQFLEDAGYIKKVQCMNDGVRVFVRHFSYEPEETPESDVSRRRNPTPNHTHDSHIHHITNDTSSVSSSNFKNKSNEQRSSVKAQSNSKKIHQSSKEAKVNDLKSLKSSLLYSRVPEKVVESAFHFYNDYYKIHDDIFGNVFKAKKNAEKYAKKNPLNVYTEMPRFSSGGPFDYKSIIHEGFRFETNPEIEKTMNEAFIKIIIKAEKEADNYDAYVYKAFYNYFLQHSKDRVNYELGYYNNDPLANKGEIPIFQIA